MPHFRRHPVLSPQTTPYQNPLQRRPAELHRDLIGAVLRPRVAHLIDVTRVASTHTDEVFIGPSVRHRSDHYSITVDVDVGRGYRGPCEIHRMPALHPAPMRTERDLARCRGRCRRYRWSWCGCRSGRWCWAWGWLTTICCPKNSAAVANRDACQSVAGKRDSIEVCRGSACLLTPSNSRIVRAQDPAARANGKPTSCRWKSKALYPLIVE